MTTPASAPAHDALSARFQAERSIGHALATLLARKPNGSCIEGGAAGATTMNWTDRLVDGSRATVTIVGLEDGRHSISIRVSGNGKSAHATDLDSDSAAGSDAMRLLAELFPSPIGRILWNEQTDRYGNKVSLALLPGGRTMRIVHHEPKKSHHRRRRSTIYRGKGSFVRLETYNPSSDCEYTTLDIAGYELCWGDGELGPLGQNDAGPDLRTMIEAHASHEDDEAAIMTILCGIASCDAVWETKEVAALAA